LGIPSIAPNYFAVFVFFIQDYAAHVPIALGIPSIAPNDFAVFVFLFRIMLRMFPAHWAFQA
jgi:hypothetical protein